MTAFFYSKTCERNSRVIPVAYCRLSVVPDGQHKAHSCKREDDVDLVLFFHFYNIEFKLILCHQTTISTLSLVYLFKSSETREKLFESKFWNSNCKLERECPEFS